MQIWTPTQQPRQDGEFAVRLNPGNGEPFAVIALSRDGQSALTMESAADCDRLIRAAVQAKSLLLGGRLDLPVAAQTTENEPEDDDQEDVNFFDGEDANFFDDGTAGTDAS